MKKEFHKILEKQHYGIVGNHSGVKICHWMRQSLLFNRECYKQTFYGIKSHRCLQMSPSINQCNHMCLFCWRHQGFTESEFNIIDDPEFILDKSIEAQKKLITGFKGDNRCDKNKWKEAIGRAYFVETSDIGRLKVSFFGPFFGGYNIFLLDQKDYSYSVVCGPKKSYLWILARTPHLDKKIIDELISKINTYGFNSDELIYVNQ